MEAGRKKGGHLRRLLRATLTVLAVGYPVALVAVLLAFRFIGESWWVTVVALYLPQVGFAIPLPAIVLALALARRWRLLLLQVASLLLLLFPLLGLSISWRGYPAEGEPSFRVLSYNVNSANDGFRLITDEILAHSPDLVFLQELPQWRWDGVKAELSATFPHIVAEDEFMVASKLPILSSESPPALPFYGRQRSLRFMRFVVETPLGPVTVFNLHTVSPRGGFSQLRGRGLRREIMSGRIVSGSAAFEIEKTAALRVLQVRAVAERAQRERGPTLIVGDSNLPLRSAARARYLGDFQDGFAEAGLGLGYTYPSRLRLMRIDLLLANDQLSFERVEVGTGRGSDHLSVFGDVVRRR